jgi:hypothetical protein
MEHNMQGRYIGVAFANVLALAVSFPVAAAEKVAGINKDFQRLAENSANIPGQPGHTLKQMALVWKSVSSNPDFGEAWVSAVAQLDTSKVRNGVTQPIISKAGTLFIAAGKALLRPQRRMAEISKPSLRASSPGLGEPASS